MKRAATALLLLVHYGLFAGYVYQKENVQIVRDTFGVPHIYGKTDADAAYGLAWAHSEDAFRLIQYNLLAAKNKLGSVLGKQGVLFDFAMQFFSVDSLVEQRYETDLSPEFRKIVEAYAQGLNDYAVAHPGEVLVKNTFPFSPQDIIKGYVCTGILLAGAGLDLKAVKENRMHEFFQPNEKGSGSNAMAIAPSRTEDGKTWLLVNSHQPIEGQMAWYEAHINSEEGWNALGGLFPGGLSIFVGCNPYLGWAHTTDYHNFGDIYELKVSRDKKRYFYDGQWRPFSFKTAHLQLRLGKLLLKVKRSIPLCEYGPVFKTKQGWYALRYPSAMDIRSAEEWYKMNKARNLTEFQDALRMDALPLFNVTYGDRDGNIFFISNGRIPLRDSALNWNRPVPGTSSKYKWTDMLPYERKISYLNPSCGFLFNCNGTPLQATAYAENSRDYFVGMQLFTYNRNERFSRLLNEHTGKFSWEDFHKIKFDKAYDPDGSYQRNFKALFTLDEHKYPDLKDAIQKIKAWNREGNADDSNASLGMLTDKFLATKDKMPFGFLMIREKPLTEDQVVSALRQAQHFLLKRYKTLDVPLGAIQRLSRGDKDLPISGLPEVPRAVDSKFDHQKGFYKMTAGDGYMQFVRFDKDGPEINSISPFGASTHPESKHYTDQMQRFVQEQFKRMSLKKEEVLRSAERIYHPGE